MTRDEERDIIERGHALWADASTDVTERIEGGEHTLEGRIIRQAKPTTIAIFHPEADYRDVAFYTIAHKLVEALFHQRARLIEYYNRQNPPPADPPPPTNYARDCAIHCGNKLFQKYMFERHGLDHPHDQQRMRTKMHSLLAIKSRTELDEDEAKRNAWLDLRADYKAWKDLKL